MGLFSELLHKYIGSVKKWAKIGWRASVCMCFSCFSGHPWGVCVCAELVCVVPDKGRKGSSIHRSLPWGLEKWNAGSFFWTVSFSGALRQNICMWPHLLECAFLCNTSASLLIQCKRWLQSTQSPHPAHPQVAGTVVCNWSFRSCGLC